MQPRLSKASEVSVVRHRISLIVLLLVVAATAGLYTGRQPLYDWVRLRSYNPPPQVAALARNDTMTSYAQKMFYLNEPVIEDKAAFAQDCPKGTEKTIVLGCYAGGESGIYLLGVSDPRLHGVEQVTGAHEMLHAAYERLSSRERQKVDAMLLDYYHHNLTDARIKATINAYKISEPDQLVNEMHSIFGTEIAKLPAPLESYYRQYFTNRRAVTTYAAEYEQVFTSREKQLTFYESQLAALKAEITNDEASLKSRFAAIQAQQTVLQQEKAAGNYRAYNAGVDSYNQKVASYQQLAGTVSSLIEQYNQVVQKHNALVLEEQQLQGELQASPAQTIQQ